jgi:predicted small lipoprotein YifL
MPIRPFTLAFLCVALCACGLRGPLYLPGDKQAAQAAQAEAAESEDGSEKPRRPAPAPQSQKRDRDDDASSPSTAPHDPDRPANVPIIPAGD